MKKCLLFIFFIAFFSCGAQDALEYKLDGSENGKSLSTVLFELEKKYPIHFYFLSEWTDPISFDRSFEGQTIGEALTELFRSSDLSFVAMYSHAIVLVKDPLQELSRNRIIKEAIREQKKVERRVVGDVRKQKKGQVRILGRIVDAESKDALPQANIKVSGSQLGTNTNEEGKYAISLSPGKHILSFTFVDSREEIIDLEVYEDGEVNIELEKLPTLLDEIIIQDLSTKEITTSRIGQMQITIRDLKRAPALLGEPDVIKQIQTLPGVTTVGEAAAGFNVRGGSVDQNLVLYDGMPVFNSSHIFGFLSSFNSESIRDVSFYRGGIPAEFGGRVSSILDIRSKDGDFEKWKGSGGIGMITSNLMINGPIVKKKTSIAASFRSTYSNWLIHSINTNYVNLGKSNVFFYDGTFKATHLLSEKTKLSLTGYSSRDAFKLLGDSTYQWENLQISSRLDHQFSSKLNGEFVGGISRYGYSLKNDQELTASELSFQITSYVAKAGFYLQNRIHKTNFGWQGLYYQFNPGTFKPTSIISGAKIVSIDHQYSFESAFYVSDEWAFKKDIFAEAGLRLPMFTSFGPASVNIYKDGEPRDINTIAEVKNFSSGQPIKAYFGLEPRLSVRWTNTPTSSFKLGYNRMYQFLHLVTNTTAVTPVDIWQPSGYYFKPQYADQISIGYFRDFKEKKYGISIETYYKMIENIIDFKDGAQLILNKHLETDLLQGKGESYGIETSVSKNIGRLTGIFSYTYSRTFRTINGPTSSESVNGGKQYPASSDQPHILNLSWKYNLARKIFFTGNFTFHSGRPITIPLSSLPIENNTAAYFSERNQYRIPDYHRLDVALVFEGNHKRKKKWEGTWVLSVYNVYGRNNPYTIFFKNSLSGVPNPYQLSIIGTPLPSISYNFKF